MALAAAEAAQEALATFKQRLSLGPGEILSYMHDALRKTRGAVAAIAEIRPKENQLIYAGVGNISGVVLSGAGSQSLVSHNGTLGITAPRIQEFRVPMVSGRQCWFCIPMGSSRGGTFHRIAESSHGIRQS